MKNVIIITLLILFSTSVIAEESIIVSMQKAKKSVVELTTEVGVMTRSKPGAIRDEKTGRILLVSSVQGAKFTRTGAGVIIDDYGTIVTNSHIAKSATRITAQLTNNTEIQCSIIKIFPNEDLAFLRLENKNITFTPVKFANSETLKLNTRLFTIGYSEVLKGTISAGKVTGIGKRKKLQNKNLVDLIQTNISVYKGDSGGPIFNEDGEFLGIILGAMPKVSKLSYAIPSSKIAKLYNLNKINQL